MKPIDTHNIQNNQEDLISSVSPGEYLRQVRVEKKWSKEKVANDLNLSVAQISALESGDYHQLNGVAYVLGYWRNYAKLLAVDITESVEIFKRGINQSEKGISIQVDYHQTQHRQEQSRKKTALALLAVGLLFLAGIRAWSHKDNTHNQTQNTQVDANSVQLNSATTTIPEKNSISLGDNDRHVGVFVGTKKHREHALPEPSFGGEKNTDSL